MRVKIEKVVFGGYGLGFVNSNPVLVEGVLPDEIVNVEIAYRKGGLPVGNVLKIDNVSEHRTTPRCPFYGICGGCDFQYVKYDYQVELKKEIVEESFERIGKIKEIPEIEIYTSGEWNYRIRAQLKFDIRENKLGFYRKKSVKTVDIDNCLLLDKSLNNLFADKNKILSKIKDELTKRKFKSFKVLKGDNTVVSEPQVSGITDKEDTLTVDSISFKIRGDTFFQNNSFLHSALANWVRDNCKGNFFIDFYGGIGFFSAFVHKDFEKGLLIESVKKQTENAKENFILNSIKNVEAIAVSSESFFKSQNDFPADDMCVIVDPPRPGLTRVVREGIANLSPKRIVYVSCNVTTQARDINFFLKNGYTLYKLALFDLYPQTHHIETAAVLLK